jgi:uncharacterized membrane protein YqaE (UPF0057 family)
MTIYTSSGFQQALSACLPLSGGLRSQTHLKPNAPPHVDRQVMSKRKRVIVDVIRILIAIILPPVGVFLQVGLGLHFWLNILLTLCGYVPGIIHAIWVILRK